MAPKGGVGTPAIAIGDIQNIKDKLKKVSVSKPEPEQKEPKVYTDSNELKAKFSFFKRKEQEGEQNMIGWWQNVRGYRENRDAVYGN